MFIQLSFKLIYLAVLLSAILSSCKNENPLPPEIEPEITLSVDFSTCTEAWLILSVTNVSSPFELQLYYNDTSKIEVLRLSDTLYYIDSLPPNTTYNLHAVLTSSSETFKSNSILLKTLTTTSHGFTQEQLFWGENSSSFLQDAVIVSDSNIWLLGEIFMNDSLGNPHPDLTYNAVHWDGVKWELKRIMYYTICGQSHLTAYPTSTGLYYNEQDIVICNDGAQFTVLDGVNQKQILCAPVPFRIYGVWGQTLDTIYVTGTSGRFLRYSGKEWTILETGTTERIFDILGIPRRSGGYTKYLTIPDKVLIYNDQDNLTGTIQPGNYVHTIWGLNDNLLYIAGGNLFFIQE